LLVGGTGLILAALLVAWFLENFERRSEQIDAGMSAQARRNHFLAAERFLERVGIPAAAVSGRDLLRDLPPVGDMLVLDGLRALNERRRAELHAWLQAGGRLFVAATGPAGEDPSAARDFTAGYGVALRALEGVEPDATVVAEVTFEQYAETLALELPATPVLVDSRGEADGAVSAGGHARVLQYEIGDGQLTVTSDMTPFTNTGIAKRDHALFLALLTEGETGGRVWLLYDSDMPWLGALLWRHAPHVLIAAIVTVLALLWQLGGRLGPLLPAAEPRRRDLVAHLRALSEFHWRHGRGSRLTRVTRERVEQAWLRRFPALRGRGDAERAAWIGQRAGLTPAEVTAALHPPAVDDRGLVAETRLLQRLWSVAGGARTHRRTERQEA
jgi:hypothetical protein